MFGEPMQCCGMVELTFGGTKLKPSILNIAKLLVDNDLGPHFNVVIFSGRNKTNTPPHTFAAWLKKQGEKVTETPWVKNCNTKNVIKAYMWVPSQDFREKIEIEVAKVKSIFDPYSNY